MSARWWRGDDLCLLYSHRTWHLEVTSTKVSYSQTWGHLCDSLSSIKTGPCNRRQIPNSAAKEKTQCSLFFWNTGGTLRELCKNFCLQTWNELKQCCKGFYKTVNHGMFLALHLDAIRKTKNIPCFVAKEHATSEISQRIASQYWEITALDFHISHRPFLKITARKVMSIAGTYKHVQLEGQWIKEK